MGNKITKVNDLAYMWSAYSEKIQSDLYSHLLKTEEGCLIVDPVTPEDDDLEAIWEVGKPDGIVILNAHHLRQGEKFREETGAPIYMSEAGAAAVDIEVDEILSEDEELPGGFSPIFLGLPSESETALIGYRILVLADAVINIPPAGGLQLLPEEYAPNVDREKLKKEVEKLLIFEFQTVLFGHGEPLQEEALEKLCQIL